MTFSEIIALILGLSGILLSIASQDLSLFFLSLCPICLVLMIYFLEKKEKANQIKKIRENEEQFLQKQTAPPAAAQTSAISTVKFERNDINKCLKVSWDVYCDPESGQFYKLCSTRSWNMQKLSLSEGVAALVKNDCGCDGREIIELLVNKHGVNSISKLFDPYVDFNSENYTYLGTVLIKTEGHLFRSNPPLETYAVVRYAAGIPVKKEEYSPFQMELILRGSLVHYNVTPEEIQTLLEKEFPNKPKLLSDYRVPGTESEELPPLPDKLKEQIPQIAESFFGEKDPVLQNPSGDTLTDRQLAIERLLQFVAAIDHPDKKSSADFDFLRCENGSLRYILEFHEFSCYDGGCGSTTEPEWLELKQVEEDWDSICAKYGLSENVLSQMEAFSIYRGSLPGDDCQCVMGFWWHSSWKQDRLPEFYWQIGVFLKDPFGLKGVFKFRIYLNP